MSRPAFKADALHFMCDEGHINIVPTLIDHEYSREETPSGVVLASLTEPKLVCNQCSGPIYVYDDRIGSYGVLVVEKFS